MSDDLFLTRLSLKHFRNFATLDVELAPQPGVMIVQGSNGLGKSSLFQGMEWLLTDQIEQFRLVDKSRVRASYLCRWTKPVAEPTAVVMGFSDGVTLTRELATPKSKTSKLSGHEDLAAYLTAPDWEATVGDLGHYLLLTHFLSQSNLPRLAHRDGPVLFDILKDAAQSRRPEAIAKALHGAGTTRPARAFKALKDKVDAAAAALRLLLDQEQAAWADAQVSGALDDGQRRALGLTIVGLIQAAVPSNAQADPDVGPIALAARLAEGRQAVEQRSLALARAKALLTERRGLQVERSTAEQVIGAAETRLAALIEAAEDASERTATARSKLETLVAQLAAEGARLASLRELSDAEIALQQLAAQPASLVATQATAQRLAAETQIGRLQRRRQIENRLGSERDALAGEIERVVRQKQAVDTLRSADLRLTDLHSALTALRAEYPDLEARLEAAEVAETQAAAVAEGLQTALSTMTGAADEITEAVSTIVANLGPEACGCPVCATEFPDPSVLRARAQAAADRLAPAIRQQQAQLEQASAQHRERVARRNHLCLAKARVDEAEAALEAERLEREGFRRRAEAEGVADSADLTRVADALAQLIESLERRLRRRSRWRAMLGAVDAAAATQSAVRQRDEAVRVIEAEGRAQADRDRRRSQLEADVVRISVALFGGDKANLEARAAEVTRLETSSAGARVQQVSVQAELAAAEQLGTLLTLERVELEARRDETRQTLRTLDTRYAAQSVEWSSLGLGGELGDAAQAAIDREEQALMSGRNALADAGAQLTRLREAATAWSKQGAHKEALERLRAHVHGAANHTREQIRTASTAELKALVERSALIARTKAIAAQASTAIEGELSTFNDEYIQPLARLMVRVNRAILCDPRIGVEFRIDGNAVNQAAVKGDLIPTDRGGINPLLVHSEGQMAALGVSLLCAASLTFPWSRWKALVLDDPLQHNDAIHASAFADFVGNIVLDRRYQVLLTTHELSQAEFLRRKFRARDIPCTLVNLLGAGEGGVQQAIQGPEAPRAAVG
ncbi:UNVERIFIED_ORG: energy-coupling factor transporter ATP-binding protein EcfA2 [Xanthobacter viscosus]|uniref:Rad50/SbcC-type AAA domain-containing protein n=1 Tax=Xanthobacter autotrophicus TaxID=280 RepID=A0A6C1KHZ8_XANAU|nr:AAA family ATPase [Xanthobacter autotrophicus]TLX43909.1 hypothetical protein FBQ73_07375 [Xanthobacter autotrophicus]